MNYSLPCSCGEPIIVSAAQAGSEATCTCGKVVRVPSLSKLKSATEVEQPTTAQLQARELLAALHPVLTSRDCPYCGREMQEGTVYGSDRFRLKWMDRGRALLLGIWAVDGEAIGRKGLFQRAAITGMRCDHCRRIVLEF
jgi:hypothetical protein